VVDAPPGKIITFSNAGELRSHLLQEEPVERLLVSKLSTEVRWTKNDSEYFGDTLSLKSR